MKRIALSFVVLAFVAVMSVAAQENEGGGINIIWDTPALSPVVWAATEIQQGIDPMILLGGEQPKALVAVDFQAMLAKGVPYLGVLNQYYGMTVTEQGRPGDQINFWSPGEFTKLHSVRDGVLYLGECGNKVKKVMITVPIPVVQGPPGSPGTPGINGINGVDGVDGTDGINGKDGCTPDIDLELVWGDELYAEKIQTGECSYLFRIHIPRQQQQLVCAPPPCEPYQPPPRRRRAVMPTIGAVQAGAPAQPILVQMPRSLGLLDYVAPILSSWLGATRIGATTTSIAQIGGGASIAGSGNSSATGTGYGGQGGAGGQGGQGGHGGGVWSSGNSSNTNQNWNLNQLTSWLQNQNLTQVDINILQQALASASASAAAAAAAAAAAGGG